MRSGWCRGQFEIQISGHWFYRPDDRTLYVFSVKEYLGLEIAFKAGLIPRLVVMGNVVINPNSGSNEIFHFLDARNVFDKLYRQIT